MKRRGFFLKCAMAFFVGVFLYACLSRTRLKIFWGFDVSILWRCQDLVWNRVFARILVSYFLIRLYVIGVLISGVLKAG